MWPAHEVLKKFGNAGLLGIDKPVEYGGLGLDYKYNLAVLGTVDKLCFWGPTPQAQSLHLCPPENVPFSNENRTLLRVLNYSIRRYNWFIPCNWFGETAKI